MYKLTPPVALSPGELFVIPEKKERKKPPDSWFYLFVDGIPAQLLPEGCTDYIKVLTLQNLPGGHIPLYYISHYLREEVLQAKDEGRDV